MAERLADVNADYDERGGIAVALASSMAEPQIRAAIEQLHSVPEARARALEAMWRSFDKTFEPYVIPHIEDPDSEVRQQAILAAGYLNLGSEAARLEKQFGDPDFRDDALFSYALCCRAEVSRPFMKKLLRQIDKLANGLDEEEVKTVMQALDLRLEMHGLKPVFSTEEGHAHE
jgi:HEAT repeat protein